MSETKHQQQGSGGMIKNNFQCNYTAEIAFPEPRHAEIVCKVLTTDEELRPDQVDRKLTYSGNVLNVKVDAIDVKTLRTSVNSLYDFMKVSIETMTIDL